ncbi:MAG TPA: glycosyltransferase family 9 protein [Thermomicrobiales bacterium]|nr:glycosyltransferase family 9 protein [Thermomicrobiales bacterium]
MAPAGAPSTAVGALCLAPPPRRIAVFRALYLGDLLCATPAFRALRGRFPDAEFTLIGLPWARDFVARSPALDRLEVFPGYPGIAEAAHDPARTATFLARARAARYDLVIQLHGSGVTSNGFVAALGARETLGYRAGDDGRLTASLAYDDGEHEILRWLRLVALAGATTDMALEYPRTPADEARADALLAPLAGPGPLVGLHPGARDPDRRWPADRFATLAGALAARHGARLVLTGAAGERPLTAAVRDALTAPALDLAGATDLGTLAAVLARLDLFVGNNTGPIHLAVAVGTPSVMLAGPGRADCWVPLDRSRHRVVDARRLAPPGADEAAALRQLPVAPVLATCERALAARRAGQLASAAAGL